MDRNNREVSEMTNTEDRALNTPFSNTLLQDPSNDPSSTTQTPPAGLVWNITTGQVYRPPCRNEKCWKELENCKNEMNSLRSEVEEKSATVEELKKKVRALKVQTKTAIEKAAWRYGLARKNQQRAVLFWRLACEVARHSQLPSSQLHATILPLLDSSTDMALNKEDFQVLMDFTEYQLHLQTHNEAPSDEDEKEARVVSVENGALEGWVTPSIVSSIPSPSPTLPSQPPPETTASAEYLRENSGKREASTNRPQTPTTRRRSPSLTGPPAGLCQNDVTNACNDVIANLDAMTRYMGVPVTTNANTSNSSLVTSPHSDVIALYDVTQFEDVDLEEDIVVYEGNDVISDVRKSSSKTCCRAC